ncbi:MAG: LamG domain-containing protein [Candidatus Poribacteria bacterium]|nr:LamG domain-containing protein [Candidatus Poribacteria bacterium]
MRGIQLARAILVSVTLICISFMISDLSSAKLDPETVLGIWFFDEGKGGTAKDSSENGNDGEIVDAQWVDGKFEGALKFEGGAHVAVGDFSDYEDEVSIVALIKTPAAPAWSDIIVGPCSDVILTLQNHKLNFAGQCGQPIPHNTWSKTLLNDDKWHYIAGTYDGKKVNVYVDGALEASNAAAGPFVAGPKYIGSRDDKQEAFTGLIDEIAFFNAALSDNDVKAIADSGLSIALGFAAVFPQAKLTTAWARLKSGTGTR